MELSHLPDDILIYKIFPQYDVSYLLYLCQINERFSIICQNNDLWHILVKRDIGIDVMPQGFNNWRNVYMSYNHLLTHPHDAIPYVEAAVIQQRNGGILTPFQKKLLDKYKSDIIPISFLDSTGNYSKFLVHALELYNPKTNKLIPTTSIDEFKILEPDENVWRYPNFGEGLIIDFVAERVLYKFFDPAYFDESMEEY
jgi:hypothetical protein